MPGPWGPAPRALGEIPRGGAGVHPRPPNDQTANRFPSGPTVCLPRRGRTVAEVVATHQKRCPRGRPNRFDDVTDDHWTNSSHGAQAGSGKRRADARLPEQTRRTPSHPAPARGQTPGEAPDQGTPLYTQLAKEWAARGATVPCRPDPLWQRLASPEHLRHETESTLRQLHLAGDPHPTDPTAQSAGWETPRRAGR